MGRTIASAAFALVAIAALGAGSASHAATRTAQSRECSAEADQQHLTGAPRRAFRARCLRGSPATHAGAVDPGRSENQRAVVAPGGAGPQARAAQCNEEAGRRNLTGNDLKEFRNSCEASAAPPSASGTKTPPAPTHSKDRLGQLPH